jgi:hypothetical protein
MADHGQQPNRRDGELMISAGLGLRMQSWFARTFSCHMMLFLGFLVPVVLFLERRVKKVNTATVMLLGVDSSRMGTKTSSTFQLIV